jgi:hypothetical protein
MNLVVRNLAAMGIVLLAVAGLLSGICGAVAAPMALMAGDWRGLGLAIIAAVLLTGAVLAAQAIHFGRAPWNGRRLVRGLVLLLVGALAIVFYFRTGGGR